MKGRVAIVGDLGQGRMAAALMVDGVLQDLLIDSPEETGPQPGAIYRAKVDRPVKGLGGMFVQLGQGVTGFLRESKGLAPGSTHLVQVVTHADGRKAAPVTLRLLFKGRAGLITPGREGRNISRSLQDEGVRDRLAEIAHSIELPPGCGMILRSAAAHLEASEIRDELEDLAALAQSVLQDTDGPPALLVDAPDAAALAWREWSDPPPDQIEEGAFDRFGVWEAWAAAKAPVPLPSGGSVVVEPTTALVAIDINSGGDTSPAAGLKATFEGIREMPRLLRLRGLGGQIVIDPAPFPKKDRPRIETALQQALRRCPVETTLVGWTPLGHIELTRKRERVPILPKDLP
ncbi:MAG: ribonuclease E/G [Pseudomonadota bacterium]